MDKHVIIVAGGQGKRMQMDIPKQFILLKGKIILMRTLEVFYRYEKDLNIIVVLPKNQINHWKTLCTQYSFTIPHTITTGGETRFHSVKNGLKFIDSNSLTAIHDGVRPLVSLQTIHNCYTGARQNKSAIPVIKLYDSVRITDGSKNRQIDREKIRIVQTPQTFNSKILHDSFGREYETSFTDDAAVIEKKGYDVHLVEGNRENIKITSPEDLALAEALLIRQEGGYKGYV
jgi:2-C-methyl-D-erythritol 4-phosphate cytidylyltransferase